MTKSLPKKFQSIFPSISFKQLNLNKDRSYIIHQLLAFGELEYWRYLSKTYPLKTLKYLIFRTISLL